MQLFLYETKFHKRLLLAKDSDQAFLMLKEHLRKVNHISPLSEWHLTEILGRVDEGIYIPPVMCFMP